MVHWGVQCVERVANPWTSLSQRVQHIKCTLTNETLAMEVLSTIQEIPAVKSGQCLSVDINMNFRFQILALRG